MHKVGVLSGDGRSVFYEDGVFTLEDSGRVGPRQLLDWADAGSLAWERPGTREWVARRASASPGANAGRRSPRTAMTIIAVVTVVLLAGGSVFGWLLLRSAEDDQSSRYEPLIRAEDARRAKAESDFGVLAKQHPEVDAKAVAKKAEVAR